MRFSTKRAAVFSAVIVLVAYASLELFAWVAYSISVGGMVSLARFQSERAALVDADVRARAPQQRTTDWWGDIHEVVHPYLGFVRDPTRMSGHSEFGFPGAVPPLGKRRDGRLIIGIFGGSFAEELATYGASALLEALDRSPAYRGKQKTIYTIAMGGYKQPQQLMALSYLLSLGAEFDIVINVDGFNDVALAPVENLPKQVFYAFPRAWPMRVQTISDPDVMKLLGTIALLEDERRSKATWFSSPPLRYSVMANVVWKTLDTTIAGRLNAARLAVQQTEADARTQGGYLASGPANRFADEAGMYGALAELWRESSEQMHNLCQANGIAYYHFLQPNQYLPGSKALTKTELEKAFVADHPYRAGVEKGYPLLVRMGERLRSRGVQFGDLTMIFSQVKDTVYRDTCCHVLHERYNDIGSRIGELITGNSEAAPARAP